MLKITIPGRPATKKTTPRPIILGVKGLLKDYRMVTWEEAVKEIMRRLRILPSKSYQAYHEFCIGTAKRPGWLVQYGNIQFTEPVWVEALYWMDSWRSRPDLIGLMQATGDILEKSGIIKNDRLIESWDGSRIMGIDRDNPRCEIGIWPI